MSDHGTYYEKVDVENKVLGAVLLKYKNRGCFDDVVGIHSNTDYLLIMDQIDAKKYTFSYFRKREVPENRCADVPHNLYEVLPAVLKVITQIVVLDEVTFASLKKELYDIREKIAESYTSVQWQTNASDAEVGYSVSTVESYEYDPHGGSSYIKKTQCFEHDTYINEYDPLKKELYSEEASEKILNTKFLDNTNQEYIRKRDIRETWIYMESKEGQEYRKHEAAYRRKWLNQMIEENGGDNCPIQFFEFSVRTYSCLYRAGVTTFGDLKKKPLSDLRKIRNLGIKSLYEILNLMRDIGIELE